MRPALEVRRILVAGWLLVVAACVSPAQSAGPDDVGPVTLRLGYFPNLTHAPALIGLSKGFFASSLGGDLTLETHTFNAGGDAVTALLSNSIDASFVGPNPTLNAFAQSHGHAVRVIAGSTSGGALLVVRPGITSAEQLKGKRIADPQLGGTQDTALRWFLRSHGFHADTAGGGDVSVLPQDNSQTLLAFRRGQIDGAWVPEPWASQLIVEGGGHALVDERDLWPRGQFVTTNLVVRNDFLQAHPRRVKALLEGLYESVTFLNANAAEAQSLANDAVAQITGKKLARGVVGAAWPHLAFTLDPLAATLGTSADHAHAVGLLASVDLRGLYDLGLLNQVLAAHQEPAVAAQ
jgi:NitT/TauT family transport system substrate-binding protein